MTELSKYPDIPIAGRSWHSFYDIVYLMEPGRIWVTEQRLGEIRMNDFMAVLNSAFGDKGNFYYAVTNGCESILVGKRYSISSCGDAFWKIYSTQ